MRADRSLWTAAASQTVLALGVPIRRLLARLPVGLSMALGDRRSAFLPWIHHVDSGFPELFGVARGLCYPDSVPAEERASEVRVLFPAGPAAWYRSPANTEGDERMSTPANHTTRAAPRAGGSSRPAGPSRPERGIGAARIECPRPAFRPGPDDALATMSVPQPWKWNRLPGCRVWPASGLRVSAEKYGTSG